jgi:hypothetical protein
MPPRGGTPWASSRGTFLSDRIRPSGASQPAKSGKGQGRVTGKGRANVAAPEPPRSAAVRRLDELIEGLLSSEATPSPSRSQPKTPNKSGTEDRDACFCQGKSSFLSPFFPLALRPHHQSSSTIRLDRILSHIISILRANATSHVPRTASPRARIIGIHAHLHPLRPHPLHAPSPAPPLPALYHAAPHSARA